MPSPKSCVKSCARGCRGIHRGRKIFWIFLGRGNKRFTQVVTVLFKIPIVIEKAVHIGKITKQVIEGTVFEHEHDNAFNILQPIAIVRG